MSRRFDPRRIEVIDDATAAMFRNMSGIEKWRVAGRLLSSARRMIAARVRHEHPTWTADQVAREVARRIAGGTD